MIRTIAAAKAALEALPEMEALPETAALEARRPVRAAMQGPVVMLPGALALPETQAKQGPVESQKQAAMGAQRGPR